MPAHLVRSWYAPSPLTFLTATSQRREQTWLTDLTIRNMDRSFLLCGLSLGAAHRSGQCRGRPFAAEGVARNGHALGLEESSNPPARPATTSLMPATGNVLIGGAGSDDFVFAHVNVGATTARRYTMVDYIFAQGDSFDVGADIGVPMDRASAMRWRCARRKTPAARSRSLQVRTVPSYAMAAGGTPGGNWMNALRSILLGCSILPLHGLVFDIFGWGARRQGEAWWGKKTSNLRSHKTADLQSAPFATRDTPPLNNINDLPAEKAPGRPRMTLKPEADGGLPVGAFMG